MNLETRKVMLEELTLKQQQLDMSRCELEVTRRELELKRMDAPTAIFEFLSGVIFILSMAVIILDIEVADGALWSLVILGLVCCIALITQLYRAHKIWVGYEIRMEYLKSNQVKPFGDGQKITTT